MVLVFFLLIHSRCGVSNLGFTAIVVDQHLLVETTLRTYFKTKGVCHICKKTSARRNVTPVRFSKDAYFHFRFQYTYAEGSLCEYIWNLIGIYVFVLNLGPMYDGILTIMSWRKPHLEHACTYISRSSIHVRSLFQGLPVRILIGIYSFACFLQTYLLLFVFSVSFSLGEATLRTFFLVALLCFLTCRHLSCFYYFPLRQRWLVEMLVVRSFLFRWYLFFSCSFIVGVVFRFYGDFVDQHLLVETTLRTYFKTKGVCHICKKKSARRNVTPVRFSKDTYFHFRFQYTYAEGSLCEYIW